MELQLAIYLCAVTSFCTAFYYYFERPILAARPRYRAADEPLPEPISEPLTEPLTDPGVALTKGMTTSA
jgi:hypothetical protein